MSKRFYKQVQPSSNQANPVPRSEQTQQRPFAPVNEAVTKDSALDLQARLEHDKRFGYDLTKTVSVEAAIADSSSEINSLTFNLPPDLQAALASEGLAALNRPTHLMHPAHSNVLPELQAKLGYAEKLDAGLFSSVSVPQLISAQSSVPGIQRSERFGGDSELEEIATGTDTRQKPSRDLQVTKLQQALIDMGYVLPKYGVDGIFGKETEAAVLAFQHDVGIPETGIFDQATLAALNNKYDTRQPYIDNATFDPADPNKGTRRLNSGDRRAVEDAMKPPRGVGGKSATFQDEVGGKKYGDRMRVRLKRLIKCFHKELFEDKKDLRNAPDPNPNFHEWSVLEGTAAASKEVTDNLYSSYAVGPAITKASGGLVDQWDDEIQRNQGLSAADKKEKAKGKVWYLIASNCENINSQHSAVPTDSQEKAILAPIVEALVDTPAEVQMMLEIEMGWEGAQMEGTVYLQRYKQANDKDNRKQLWELFHTCIHEYIHSLVHDDYEAYARRLDVVRQNTLIEGFCDFFTENVRKTITVTPALRQKIEGPYYDAKEAPPSVSPSIYSSIAEAERVVSIVGIRNAQAAYFQGKVKLIGGR